MNKKQQVAGKLVEEARRGGPWSPRSIVLYLLAIAYVFSPVDFVPDALPGFGQLDDGAVILAVILYFIRLSRRKKGR